MPTIDMMKLPAGTDIMAVLGDEKMAQKILQKQNQIVRLSGNKLYKALKVGWIPRNFITFIFKPKLSFFMKNNKNDN